MPTRTLIAIAATIALSACAAPQPLTPSAASQPVAAEPAPAAATTAPPATTARAIPLVATLYDAPLANAECRAYPLGAPEQAVRLALDANGEGALNVPDAWIAGTPIVVVASGESGTVAAVALTPAAATLLQATEGRVSLSVAHGLAYALLRPRLEAIAQLARQAAGGYDPAPVKASLQTLQAFSNAMASALAAAPAPLRQSAARALDASGTNPLDAGFVNALRAAAPALDAAFDTAARALASTIQAAVAAGAAAPDARLTGSLTFGSRAAQPVYPSGSGGGGSSVSPTPAPVILEGQAE